MAVYSYVKERKKKMETETVKGFKDYSGEEARLRVRIKEVATGVFEKYGFEPAETPIVEYEEFVVGDNKNDEAVSDVYKLVDKGNRKLALRYELTFQLKRLANGKKLPYKRYQIGEVFRDEPTGQNRMREFTQCDIDVIGSDKRSEAEVLCAISELLSEFGIKADIYFNNRKLMNEILDKAGIKIGDREAIIREIDKLDKMPESEIVKALKKYGAEKILGKFNWKEESYKNYDSFSEINDFKSKCKDFGVKVNFLPTLARGLSYYDGDIFEIRVKNKKESICGGGSYTFNGIKSTGISFSIERISVLCENTTKKDKILLISLNQDKKAISLAKELREKNIICGIFYGKPSKALEYADSYGYKNVIFIGDDEVTKKEYKIRDMKTGKESLVGEKDVVKKLEG